MPRPLKGMFRRGNSWYIRIYDGGKDRWISLGPDLGDACRKVKRLKRGDEPASVLTVNQAAERWLEVYITVARSEKNWGTARYRVKRYLGKKLGYKQLSSVKPDDIRLYRLWLEKQGICLQTVAHILSDCRCFFLWCEDSGLIDKTPFRRRMMPRIQEKPPARLSDEEVEFLVRLQDPYGFVIRFGLSTGLRWGEMARAQIADIQKGRLVVSQTKTGRVRRIPLPAEMRAELRGRVGKIVPFGDKSHGAFARMVRRLSGIQDFRCHRMRHTFACRWLERGGSIAALQQILGHSTIVTTQRYGKLSDDAVEREVGRVFPVQTVADPVAKNGSCVNWGQRELTQPPDID